MDDQNVILYRIDRLEETVENKLEELMDAVQGLQLNNTRQQTKAEGLEVRVENVEEEQAELGEKVHALELHTQGELSILKVGMAERFGPGALAGGLIAILGQLVSFMVKFLTEGS